jgi:hypothetical protein
MNTNNNSNNTTHGKKGKTMEKVMFFFYFSHGVSLSPLGTAATTSLLYQPDDR